MPDWSIRNQQGRRTEYRIRGFLLDHLQDLKLSVELDGTASLVQPAYTDSQESRFQDFSKILGIKSPSAQTSSRVIPRLAVTDRLRASSPQLGRIPRVAGLDSGYRGGKWSLRMTVIGRKR